MINSISSLKNSNKKPDHHSPACSSWRISLFVLILIGMGWISYSNTLNSPFYLDDFQNIFENPHVQLTRLDWESLSILAQDRGFRRQTRGLHRPASMLSFALNYYFGQYEVFGYHLVNTIIHIMTGIFLFFLFKTTLRLCNKPDGLQLNHSLSPDIISFFAALIWLVHPLHTESVTYIVQRMNSMAGMFYILSLFFYINGRISQRGFDATDVKPPIPKKVTPYIWFAGCFLSGILAVASKQNAGQYK